MKKYKVIGVPWHVGHQYELMKLPFIESYDLMINPYRTWGEVSRPFPEKTKWVTHYEKGKYDFAILHIDQQCVEDRITKGILYKDMNEVIDDIPKIVINHMTPFHDHFSIEETKRRVKEMVGNNFMIVNSQEAAEQWEFGHFIRHGLSPEEWPSNPKEPRITTFISKGGMERAYKRSFLQEVIYYLEEWGHKFYWIGADVSCRSWDEYREWMSRSLIYFNATYQSPMPRSRTEAMFSGCCIVTTPFHDADKFIKNGENGFIVGDNPQEVAQFLIDLVVDKPDLARKVGENGRKFAHEYFSFDNFSRQWLEVIEKVVGK